MRTFYRCLLLACPPTIRRELGSEMEDVFVQCAAVARNKYGWLGGPVALGRGLVDALAFAVRAHRDERQRRRAETGGASGRRSPFMFRRHEITTALRQMRQRPIGTAAIVLMLALGIGASTAMFSVVYGVLLQPLPFPDADRLVRVYGARPDRGWTQVALTEANYWDVQDLNHTFEYLGGYRGSSAILTGDTPEQVSVGVVSSGFFKALGVTPVAGRLFTTEDDATGHTTRPVLLSHALWMRKYGGERGVVGRPIMFASGPRTIVGVLPPGTPWLNAADLFTPLVRRADANRSSFEYVGIGRLKPGVSMETALADLQAVSKTLAERHPNTNTGLTAELEPARDWLTTPELRRTLWILLGAVGLLLVIACVNVANLLLARASSRGREIAVRSALGATRIDLIRLTLVESLLLAVLACAAGLLVASGLLSVIRSVNPDGIPRITEVALNGWVFLFASAVTAIVGIATGLAPALQSPRSELARALRQGMRGSVGDRRQALVRGVFVGAEVALSLMLLVGAGLLVRSLVQVLQVDRGFQADNRVMLSVTIPAPYGEARIIQTSKTIIERVRALPDVVSAAAVSGRPLTFGSTGLGLGIPERADAETPWGTWRMISSDYFKTIGVRLLAGRDFTDQDLRAEPRRVVISQRLAEMFWPGESPVGRAIVLWKGQGNSPGEVVGVVSNMRERGLENDHTLAVYFPGGELTTNLQLVIHSRPDADATIPAVRGAIAAVDKALPISNIRTLESMVDQSMAARRFTMMLLVGFAGLALLLTLAGVYGVLAYSVARRTAEIGVRLALGAGQQRVLGLVLAQGMRPVLAGLVVGLAGAYWLSQVMTSMLFRVDARDPWTFIAVPAVLAVVGVLACYLPARQVLKVDPVVALRIE